VGYHVNLAKNLFKAAIKSQYKITHEYALEGLRFGIIVLANEITFSSQTKENLKSITKVKIDDFAPVVKEIEKTFRKFSDYWDAHFERVNQFWDAHRNIGAMEKAQKMMDSSTGSSFYRSRSGLVKGFSDATCSDRTKCSLYLCEGDSPAGALKAGRKTVDGSLMVGVCPLRGKVLNVSDVDIDRALENKEISTIFSIIGVGIQEKNVTTGAKSWEEAHERLRQYSRFSKICIACDADSDGQQITMLLLYLFSKYARFLVDHGYIYISVSPLFEQGGKFYYPGDPVDTNGVPIGINTSKSFRRFKGLTITSPSI
jgi:DNA gyrase subunit B